MIDETLYLIKKYDLDSGACLGYLGKDKNTVHSDRTKLEKLLKLKGYGARVFAMKRGRKENDFFYTIEKF